ncbi:MAG: Cu(I)/Ag(I) efflux system membrane protein CusA/SilA [Planctomycetota bacterium]
MLTLLVDACIKNRFLVGLVATLLALAGAWSLLHTPIDALPDLSEVQVVVASEWLGHDPETVEDHVTRPIETALLAVPGVREVRGQSFFGGSFAYAIFDDNTDLYWARARVLEQLSRIQPEMPAGVVPSLGPDATGLGWVYVYCLEDQSGQLDLGQLRQLQDDFIAEQVASVRGVAEVASLGGAPREIQVTLDPMALVGEGISPAMVVRALKRSSGDAGGRLIEVGEAEHMLRARGVFRSLQDIELVPVGRSSPPGMPLSMGGEAGRVVLLRDVASVELVPGLVRGIADRNGEGDVVAGIVAMRSGENALTTIERVKQRLIELAPGLPEGVRVVKAYDRSGLIKRSIATLSRQLIEELLIVALVCILFLWHARSALVSVVVLPLGLLLAFLAMRIVGVDANVMSLGGLAIAIGAMVDASIVLVENVHKHAERAPEGTDRWAIVSAASREVCPALFLSLLVITVSFLPVFSLQGQAGRLFHPLAWTKTFAMGAAALLSITVLPPLAGWCVRGRIRSEEANPLSRLSMGAYLPVLRWALNNRVATIVVALVCMLATIIPWSNLGTEFMPPIREGDVLAMPTTLPGISATEARRTLQIQDRILAGFPEVEIVLGKAGRAETPLDPAPLSMLETHITLLPQETWPARVFERELMEELVHDLVEFARSDDWMRADAPEAGDERSIEEATEVAFFDGLARLRVAIMTARSEALDAGLSADDDASIYAALEDAIVIAAGRAVEQALSSRGLLTPEAHGRLVHALVDRARDGFDVSEVELHPTNFDDLVQGEMDHAVSVPGMPNWWLMPIETRLGMLATGMKGEVGIKLLGRDLGDLAKLAEDLEPILAGVPGTSAVLAERALGGRYLDVDIDRLSAANFGLTVGDVQDVVRFAVGGMPVTTAFEGRSRLDVSVRYPRELRDSPEALASTLVWTPSGKRVPLGQVATVRFNEGPPAIKSQDGQLLTNVPIALSPGADVGTYVRDAKVAIDSAIEAGELVVPAGTTMRWSGEFQLMQEVSNRLRLIIPLTLGILFLLVYLQMRNVVETLITLVTLPFALTGGLWLVWMLDYQLSVAVIVGFLALAGLATETAILMHLYLRMAWEKRAEGGHFPTGILLREAVMDGAVSRLRPKLMTVVTTMLALLPILWATGTGSEPMRRMAAPMIGGLVTSTLHTLILIPIYFAAWKEREARHQRARAEFN